MLILFLPLALLFIGSIGYYIFRFLGRYIPSPDRKSAVGRAVAAAALTAASTNLFSIAGIVLLHFWVLSMVTDCVFFLLQRYTVFGKSRKAAAALRLCIIPLLLTAAITGWGMWNMGRIVPARYTLDTGKPIRQEGYRVLLITDIHYGTIQDTAVLEKSLPAIAGEGADIIILGGDIVEEGTSKEEMQTVFRRLGTLQPELGTYYICGNHDRQYYSRSPQYTPQELTEAITGNGITILCDGVVPIGDDILLAGREDLSSPGLTAGKLLENADKGKLIITADHQPSRWLENAAAGTDITLSGHTHGGQVFPIDLLLEWIAPPCIGHYRTAGSDLYVSSGFAGWGFPVRTAGNCEYVVLDIR